MYSFLQSYEVGGTNSVNNPKRKYHSSSPPLSDVIVCKIVSVLKIRNYLSHL